MKGDYAYWECEIIRVFKCNDKMDDSTKDGILHAVEDLMNGELIVYPTETVYGVGADIFNQKAVKELYIAKKRPFDMPLSVAVSDIEMVERVAIMTRPVEKLIEAFLPGPLTIITKKNPDVPNIVTSMSQKVGFRIPDHPVALELIKRFGGPIITTSANLHSHPDAINIDMAIEDFSTAVSTYLDSGSCTMGKPSTIVWLMNDKVEVIRQGVITKKEIEDVLNA